MLLVSEYVCKADGTVAVNLAERVMKVDSPKNLDQVAGMCCRQSPLRGLVGGLIVCAVLIGFVFLLWHREAGCQGRPGVRGEAGCQEPFSEGNRFCHSASSSCIKL